MKRIFYFIVTITLISVLSLPSLIFAGEPKNDYIVFRGGMFSPGNDDIKDYFDPGINLEFAYGTWTSKYLGAELGIGFFQTRSNKDFPIKTTVTFGDIFYNGKVRYHADRAEIYGGAGMGVYFSKVEARAFGISDSNMETNYGFQVVAGGNVDIRQDLFVGIEGKYLWTKSDEIDARFDGFTVSAIVGTRF